MACHLYRRGLVSKPSGLGDPTATVLTVRWCLGILIRVLRPIRLIRDSDQWDMSPLWGFGVFVCPVCYIHAAPLGLKAPVHQNSRHGIHRRGEVSKPSGLGDPTATVSTVRWCLGILIRVLRPIRLIRDSDQWDMSPLWGFGVFVCAACYKHAAPLGLSAAKLTACHLYRRGLVSKPSGLGDPTATVSIPLFSASLLLGVLALNIPSRITRTHVAPLGLWCVWCMPRAINMPPLWG